MSNNVDTSFQRGDTAYYNIWLSKLLDENRWDDIDKWDGTNELTLYNVAHYHPPHKNEMIKGRVSGDYWKRVRDIMHIYNQSAMSIDGEVTFTPEADSTMIPKYQELLAERNDFNTASRLGLTVPFSHNTGPFNDIVEPSNTADEHALQHDIEYSKGGDVRDTDDNFIKNMFDHAVGDPVGSISQITGLLGGAGISAKKAIETKTGQLYPAGNV